MAFSSPPRLVPPLTPRRAPSPIMSPGGRRGRTHGTSDEGRLRDLSPDTTLRAFTQKPMPFDTTCDEYKIFSCIDTLTAAERDLGARVAKAAQRLKSWCAEIEQWGWTGSFEPPSEEYREKRRKSLELRIREHVGNDDSSNMLPPLEYWGSLLSIEVESHEARLDDMEEEMLKLDVEELKEHVLDMHPIGRSRPSSAGIQASRQSYTPMDDFSFLITQTLLSALPHHAQLKDRLNAWTARIAVLREVPHYLEHLATAQKAMSLGWNAIETPADTTDVAFTQWKDAVDTISGVLGHKVSDLGQRLDKMLDTLEGREDCIPDGWIDTFEHIETDHGRWAHESRRRIIDFDVRRRGELKGTQVGRQAINDQPAPHSKGTTNIGESTETLSDEDNGTVGDANGNGIKRAFEAKVVAAPFPSNAEAPESRMDRPDNRASAAVRSITAIKADLSATTDVALKSMDRDHSPALSPRDPAQDSAIDSSDQPVLADSLSVAPPNLSHSEGLLSSARPTPSDTTPRTKPWFLSDDVRQPHPSSSGASRKEAIDTSHDSTGPVTGVTPRRDGFEPVSIMSDHESDFEEGDTMVHNEIDNSPESAVAVQPVSESMSNMHNEEVTRVVRRPASPSEAPAILTHDGEDNAWHDPPQTPRSRRGSFGSVSSDMSFDSSPSAVVEESPSVRNRTNRAVRVPRPELNAAMAKRRSGKSGKDSGVATPPWPPTQFSQKSMNSADDLERKISDILTTIPAHIRLTSGPGPDAPEVKPTRGLAAKGSRAYLRAARSASGLKSPELTLSPAKHDTDSANAASGRKSAATIRSDNDIKLYHLTQPGKEQPIKLFIRRVGENGERVMVRVGGGWADLGEYLRQYAEHHGRRTASDGKFEILGLEVKNNDTVSSPTRPESTLSTRDRRFSGGHQLTSPSTTPIKATGPGIPKDEAPPTIPSYTSTPVTGEEASFPSSHSSRRSWTGNEVGLAGPKSKKLDLSGEKLDWIEGMMKQARTVSGNVMTASHTPLQRDERTESRSEERSGSRAGARKPEFGDLGKVGGTKRIFLKGGRPSLEEQH